MKKTLALVLALAMVFSTITVAFAEDTLGADAQTCANLGMLKGETGTVDAAYVATAPTRLQAAVMFLRLKGLEAEALAFTGEDNFADGNIAWAEGANLLAYLKANPQLGWIGDGTNFNPTGAMTAQAYYKVLLEALGYKQTTTEVEGDFAFADVITFAAGKGLTKVAAVENFTVNDLAIATVEALKTNVKDTEAALYKSLYTEEAAAAAGLIEAAPAAVAAELKEAKATGSAVVEVTFKAAVDEAAENVANYAIEGLDVNSAAISGTKTVILSTSAMTSGKLYKLTVGEKTVQFTGIAKVSGGPEIEKVVSEDVEEVVITFKKNIDLATGSDIANYSISGVEIVSAEVDEDEVTLTTEGLKNKTKYTVKVTNVKSVDGVAKKSDSDSFTVKYDLIAPKIEGNIEVQTNERIKVTFSEEVTQESAENLENYSIKVDETDGAELEIVSITWDDDDENNVEIVTEPMEKREDYKISINNIADQRKVANVMSRPATKTFEGIAVDETAPRWETIRVLSPTTIMVEFSDGSKLDEDSALDLNNYDLEDLDIESIETIKNEWKVFRALLTVEEMETGKSYDLTIVDVLDEYGNAMKETTKIAKGLASSFASAKALSAAATGENTILVLFNDELDEDSAEDISNYEIDEEVGAPTKAVYEYKDYDKDGDKEYGVTLTVNDLVNGYEYARYNNLANKYQVYDLTIDGVEDLAGNELYYELEVDTTTKWNTSAPELEDVDVIDNKVIALAFDEAVKFNAAPAQVVLWPNVVYNEDGTVKGTYTDVTLTAKDYADDFSVVEFSAGASEAALVYGNKYTVVKVVYGANDGGITDLIGNPLAAITLGDFEFEAAAPTDNPEGAEVDSYEQTNAKTFEVTMTKFVAAKAGADLTDVAGFTATIDEDVITLTRNSGYIDEVDYTMNLANFFVDKHGVPVQNADTSIATVLAGEYKDEDAPYIDEVVATNRVTIKVTFNEDILASSVSISDFTLKNYDLDKTVEITGLDDNDGDNVIKLTVTKPLEARYEYELTLKKASVKDIATIDNEDAETFYFDGTNLAERIIN